MYKDCNKKILKIFSLLIIIGVPLVKFMSKVLEQYNVIANYDMINPGIILYFSSPILLYIYIRDLIYKERKIELCDYIFLATILSGVLATVFSIDKEIAMFGSYARHEGFLSVIAYYLLFINWRFNGTKKDIHNFIKLVVFIAVINSIYGILQIYTPFNFIIRYQKDVNMASGLCLNPNFFGSLIVTTLGIIVCNFLMENKSSVKEYIIIILLLISLVNAQSMGPIITFVLILLFLFFLLFIKNFLVLKKFVIICLLSVIVFTLTLLINNTIYSNNRCELCLFKNSVEKTDYDEMTNGRIEIWKNSLNIIKNNFLFGVGFDNFYLAYPNKDKDSSYEIIITNDTVEVNKPEKRYVVDNAHNVYLHTFSTTGIIGLVPFLLLHLLVFLKGIKSKNKLLLIMFSGFIAYSVQAFANISVIIVAPIFYIIVGLILSISE